MKQLLLLLILILISCNEEAGVYTNNLDGNTAGDGQNGSYTAMVAVRDRLYYVDFNNLYTADISDPKQIEVIDEKEVGTSVETIFFRNGVLFIGSGTALIIYALDADGIPSRVSETLYSSFDGDFRPCDPVVADDNFAYVTLSSTPFTSILAECTRNIAINQLRIYSLESVTEPALISTTNLQNPKGLAIDGNTLFVCDSQAGLKIFDISDRSAPVQIREFTDIATFDAIARDGLLIVTGPSVIAEYNYSDLSDIKRISTFNL